MQTPSRTDMKGRPSLNTFFLESNFERLHVSKHNRKTVSAATASGIIISKTTNGIPTLSINGAPIYDPEDPVREAARQVNAVEGDDQSNLVALFGLGLGYHAEQLERRFSCPIIVFDPSVDAVRTVLEQRLMNLQRTILVVDSAHLVSEIQPKIQFNDRKVIAAAIPAYQNLFPEEFDAFVAAVEQAMSNARIMEHTVSVRSADWIQHGVQIVPKAARHPGIDILYNRFKGVPAVLVSAGPSLDKNIDALKAAEGHALIAAVNAAAAPLAKAGIRPDLIAVVEGLDLRAQLADLPWLDKVALAPTLACFPGFYDLNVRKIFTVADQSAVCSDWFVRAYQRAYFSSGGSVSCSTYSLLHALGCDPIILIGQDLAYTDGLSYSSAATFGKQTMEYDEKTKRLRAVESDRNDAIETIRKDGGLESLTTLNAVEVPAYGGNGLVYTVGIYNMFRDWFETTATTWAKDRTLINATEGGARISGFTEMPLAEAIAAYCTKPISISNVMDDAVAESQENNVSALADAVDEDIDIIEEIMQVTRKATQASEKALRVVQREGLASAEPALRHLTELETELRRLTRTNRIIDAYVSGKVNTLRRERHQDLNDDVGRQTANSLRRTIKLLQVIEEGCTELKGLFGPLSMQLREMET